MNLIAQDYLRLLGEEQAAKLALFACSMALRLDDEIAQIVIESTVGDNASSGKLLYQVKNLGCVWRDWDGSWCIAEDVRRDFVKQFYEEMEPSRLSQLRERLVDYNDQRIQSFSPDGQITVFRVRQAKLEAAFHRILIPEQAEEGAAQMTQIWRNSSSSVQESVAGSVEYLAEELSNHLESLPADILFLRGMAARARRGSVARREQLEYFGAVYTLGRQGGRGFVYGVAAHLYGLLLRNREKAKRAFQDGIDWYDSSDHQAQVYNSLGNLLSDYYGEEQWPEAEAAFNKSLALRHDRSHQGQVYHSLGKLLSKDYTRWDEAQSKYGKSLGLRDNPKDKAQVLTSWADLLLEFETLEDYARAVEFAEKSLKLDPHNLATVGMSNRILAVAYEHLGKYDKAIAALQVLRETNHKLGKREYESKVSMKITALRQRNQVAPEDS